MVLQWSDLGSAAGAAALAAGVMLLVEVLKAAIPPIFRYVTGAAIAFLVTLALYIYGAWVIALPADLQLSWGLSWLACAATALGIHATIQQGASTFVKRPEPTSAPPTG